MCWSALGEQAGCAGGFGCGRGRLGFAQVVDNQRKIFFLGFVVDFSAVFSVAPTVASPDSFLLVFD